MMRISSEKKSDIGNNLDLVVSPITQMIHLTIFCEAGVEVHDKCELYLYVLLCIMVGLFSFWRGLVSNSFVINRHTKIPAFNRFAMSYLKTPAFERLFQIVEK